MARKYSKKQSKGRVSRIKSSKPKSKKTIGKKDMKAFAQAISERFQNGEE